MITLPSTQLPDSDELGIAAVNSNKSNDISSIVDDPSYSSSTESSDMLPSQSLAYIKTLEALQIHSQDILNHDSKIVKQHTISQVSLYELLETNTYCRFLLAIVTRNLCLAEQALHIFIFVNLSFHFNSRSSSTFVLTFQPSTSTESTDMGSNSAAFYFYLAFIMLPYIVLSFFMIAPLTYHVEMLHNLKEKLKHLLIQSTSYKFLVLIVFIIVLPVYSCIMILFLIFVDLFIYIALFGKDLSQTRYFNPYWNMKRKTQTIFATIPGLLYLFTHINILYTYHNINWNVLMYSAIIGCLLAIQSLFKLGNYVQTLVSKTECCTLDHHYSNTEKLCFAFNKQPMIPIVPYLDAIKDNTLRTFRLHHENLRDFEWCTLCRNLFFNQSISSVIIINQTSLSWKTWCLLFFALTTKRLHRLNVQNCRIFGNLRIKLSFQN